MNKTKVYIPVSVEIIQVNEKDGRTEIRWVVGNTNPFWINSSELNKFLNPLTT